MSANDKLAATFSGPTAAHHAAYVILDRIGTDVQHVAYTQVTAA